MTGQLLHPPRRRFGHGARSFEAIYDRHHAALFAFCRHMLGSREEAEDALQQVFVSAYRELRAGREPEHLRAWLYAIARNRCVSMLRARRETPCADPVAEASDLGVADAVERREELEELLGDLARLPDDQRAALVLAELGDLAHDEIGEALGVRRDKVKALIFQAREALGGWRAARAASCHDVQEQLATLRGSALRRAALRRHVAVCPACAAFEGEVARQRSALALLVPAAPGLAVKYAVLAAAGEVVGGGAAAAGGVAAGGAAAGGLSTKVIVAAALALSAGGAGTIGIRALDPPRPPAAHATRPAAERPAAPAAPAAAYPVAPVHARVAAPRRAAAHRRPVAAHHVPRRVTKPSAPARVAPSPTRPATAPAPAQDNGQHGRPAVPPGLAKQGKPAPAHRPVIVPTAPPAAHAAPVRGKSAAAPGHTKR